MYDKSKLQQYLDAHPFKPAWGLGNAHGQTIAARYLRRLALPNLQLERWHTADDDFLRIHLLAGEHDAPTVLISHGLEGSVQSSYVVSLLKAIQHVGWQAVVFEHRSCGGEMNRARRLYHSGETSDLAFVVQSICQRRPEQTLFIAGYSLGGNQLAKWLGMVGDQLPTQVKGAAVISAPFDLAASAAYMDSGIRLTYVRHFLRKLIPKALEKEQQYPGCLDSEKIKLAKTFRDFDNHATAPLHDFQDADDYYHSVGCGQFLNGIRCPSLLLSAADDPFNPPTTLPIEMVKQSDYLISQFPQQGGHVGFVERAAKSEPFTGTWADKQILRFFAELNR